jgi:hypothetical protein
MMTPTRFAELFRTFIAILHGRGALRRRTLELSGQGANQEANQGKARPAAGERPLSRGVWASAPIGGALPEPHAVGLGTQRPGHATSVSSRHAKVKKRTYAISTSTAVMLSRPPRSLAVAMKRCTASSPPSAAMAAISRVSSK